MPSKKGNNSKRISDDFVVRHLMDFYDPTDTFNSYCTKHFIDSKCGPLHLIGVTIGLFRHKTDKGRYTFVHKKLSQYLREREQAFTDHVKQNQQDNKLLTEDKEALVVRTCEELSTMGLGID